ncbi:Acetoin:2,6-dichlorophenolindophenol oxidoreductase subunit beta [Candidatus Sulfotelmatomonas gaucii]|uniref:Acetoin:2,6-dichlorophenolindophenol oxidoreductase subunit beta n=1 Tax=Candidatus Sulfuritelmatomonas gaucii TaxID=2043161 RepID=A0A2N9MA25_9BACT|nr:Acetoin:2,6-dichlorophenolindophenol oxidoreductase subunit beta [Candidatus Sulfotelmatomonas gaucii]
MYTPANGQRSLRYVDALREATIQEMERDKSVFLFGLDVDDHKGIQGSTIGLQDRFGPERVFGTPLSEDAMTGVAIGAAMAGMRPIHVHIRMDFVLLCMNQLVNMAAKAHYMYGGQVRVPIVIRCMIGKSWGQGAQHSQALHSMFMHVPGLKVVMPSNAHDAKGCLIAAIRDDNPVLFIEHRLLYSTECYVPEEPYTVEMGRARICASGTDITLVGISNMVMECLRARDLLSEVGISAEVIDPISLAPLDIDAILNSVNRTGGLLVVDCAWTNCGASAEILARISESPKLHGPVQMERMGFAFSPCPPSPPLEQAFYPDPSKIAAKVHSMVRPLDREWSPDPEKTILSHELQFRGPF